MTTSIKIMNSHISNFLIEPSICCTATSSSITTPIAPSIVVNPLENNNIHPAFAPARIIKPNISMPTSNILPLPPIIKRFTPILPVHIGTFPIMKRPIDLDLLHRRLGHISSDTLLFGSKQDSWRDVSAVSNGSTFCAPCKLTMIPKTRRSHTPVTIPLIPGAIGAFDIVPNPCITLLTQDCIYNYLLFCMDVCIRQCEIFGMKLRNTQHIIKAIIAFEQRMGYNFKSIHSDAGVEFSAMTCLRGYNNVHQREFRHVDTWPPLIHSGRTDSVNVIGVISNRWHTIC